MALTSEDIQVFADQAYGIASVSDLAEFMATLTPRLGFRHYAISQDMGDPDLTKIYAMYDFPEAWEAVVNARNYWRDDPVAFASRRAITGFWWRDIPKRVTLTDAQAQVLQAAAEYGLVDGYTIPAALAGEPPGAVTFAMGPGDAVDAHALAAAHMLGSLAFETRRRLLIDSGNYGLRQRLALSPRQRDCVALVAQGKSDWEIGAILGISADTAHKHVQAAMQRADVKTRTQLAVRAVMDDLISPKDLYGLKRQD